MEFFRIKKDIPFMRHALIFNVISALTFVAAVFFLATRGLHLSVEFKGGTVMELKYPNAANQEKIRADLVKLGYEQPEVTSFGTAQEVMLRLPITKAVAGSSGSQIVFDGLCKSEGGAVTKINAVVKGQSVAKDVCHNPAGAEVLSLQKVEFVGPQVGDELAQNGVNALIMVVLFVVFYLAVRFEWKYAVSAIIANLHDVVIILGFFAFFQWEFSLAVLAGVLAVLGYSVNESVVIFDRIRENFRKQRKASVEEVIDNAITSTISRTIITHGCTQMMVLSMLLLGGATLHYFAVALTIGILFGIYSSVFVAAAIAMWLGVKREDLIKPIKEKDETDGAVV
ncbi:protein translocase subunit SecF [Massilia sp. CCM 8695]|uniref:Protein-export membrane protein SecF n=1 Tax=Massilia frigida TaxID=2609281 RepID=A0ABX0NG37_9BURK|nr:MULTISPECIES: protein translocase subunit SecF [Massilia]MDM5177750.1 protein translocase subunit SecF [Massilia sp. DJPM01]NHZ83503.1 protein translocase subunit SecF [Massilia frigida]